MRRRENKRRRAQIARAGGFFAALPEAVLHSLVGTVPAEDALKVASYSNRCQAAVAEVSNLGDLCAEAKMRAEDAAKERRRV